MPRDQPEPQRPVAIVMSGKNSDVIFGSLDVEGDGDLLRMEGENSGVIFGAIKHSNPAPLKHTVADPPTKRWWERPLGFIALTVLAGVIVAAISFYLGLTE